MDSGQGKEEGKKKEELPIKYEYQILIPQTEIIMQSTFYMPKDTLEKAIMERLKGLQITITYV